VKVKASHVGEAGFVRYLHELHRRQVISRREVVAWTALHGALIRHSEPPLDDGDSLDEEALSELQRELGSA
jgi:hypothetical protein